MFINYFSSITKVETLLFQHTAPQHRQYLSYEGYGHGTPFQRQKQYTQARAERAAINVMEHRMEKAKASEKTLMKKGTYGKKHDIKTKYGFDRLVEDLIQESMSKGEFENLSGKGKPLKDQNSNPYVDFTTHKLNEVRFRFFFIYFLYASLFIHCSAYHSPLLIIGILVFSYYTKQSK